MNRNTLYTLIILSFTGFCFAQTIELNLKRSGVQGFNGKIYTFGLIQTGTKPGLIIYELNHSLIKTDSLQIDNLKGKTEDYLALSSDTLHDQLNIYLQNKEKRSVQILKINKKFKTAGLSDETEVARVNSLALFQNDIYYYKNEVYTLRSSMDTSGRQFFLNKHSLKTEKTNFEYEQKWQFPLERKYIRSARIIYADRSIVLIFVQIGEGTKKGQWLLKVSAMNGNLRKGIRIGEKNELNSYYFNQVKVDTAIGRIYLTGQKFSDRDLDLTEKKFNLSGKTAISFYLAVIDSGGDVTSNTEFKLPVVEQKGYVSKTPVNYMIRMNSFEIDKENNITIATDVYKSKPASLCYQYCNSAFLKIKEQDGMITLEKNSIGTHPMIEKYHLTNDPLDMNGKLCIDSLNEFDKLFTKNINLKICKGFKMDESGNPVWLLNKSETKKGTEKFSILGPVKKIYQLSSVAQLNKSEVPSFLLLSSKNFLVTRQAAEDKFLLQIFNW